MVVPRAGLDAGNGKQVPDSCLCAATIAFHGLRPSQNEEYINAVMYWSDGEGKM